MDFTAAAAVVATLSLETPFKNVAWKSIFSVLRSLLCYIVINQSFREGEEERMRVCVYVY